MEVDRRRFLAMAAGALAGVAPGRGAAAREGSGLHRVHRATRNTPAGALGRWLLPSGARPGRAKAYAGRPRIALPGGPPDAGASLAGVVAGFEPAAAVGATAPLPLASLARVLRLANGVTGPRGVLRAAPSAGALYAGEVYLLAARVEGLAAGVYSYHVPSDSLIRLRASDEAVARAAAATERPDLLAAAPAVLLLTNVFLRYTHRYRNRGYRYALIDSGHIGENLRLAASSTPLGCVSPLRFRDDALNALLAIDGRGEAVCAVHAIGESASRSDAPGQRLVEAGRSADASASGETVPERFHAATKLVAGAGPAPAQPDRVHETAAEGRALPSRERPAMSLDRAVRTRRSAMRFREEAIPLADLSFLLEMAQGNPRARQAPWIELRPIVHRVAGLPPGVFAYDRTRHALVAIREGNLRAEMGRACMGQEKAQSAAVGFAMLADLRGAAAHGDRAYRDLLIEAGAVGQRIYLAAEAIGLAARNLAAFYDDAFDELVGADGESAAVVHLTMAGPGD